MEGTTSSQNSKHTPKTALLFSNFTGMRPKERAKTLISSNLMLKGIEKANPKGGLVFDWTQKLS